MVPCETTALPAAPEKLAQLMQLGNMQLSLTPPPFPSNSSGFQGQQLVQSVQEVPPGRQVPEHALHVRQAGGCRRVLHHAHCLCEVLVAVSRPSRGGGKALAGGCVQDTAHGGCALESTQDHHLRRSVLELLGDTWLLRLLAEPNNRCKGLLTAGFSSEAVCTRILQSLASPGSFPFPGHSGNSQSVLFSIIILYILLLSSSSGNWTLMNIPCVGNVCFFRIWVCSYFSFFLFSRLPSLKANISLYINQLSPLSEYLLSVLCLTSWLVTL